MENKNKIAKDGYFIDIDTSERFCSCGDKMTNEDDCFCCLCSWGIR